MCEDILRAVKQEEESYQRFLNDLLDRLSAGSKRDSDLRFEFREQTDRGAGIVGAAILEPQLTLFIIAHLANSKKKLRDKRNACSLFDRGQAMENFGSQITLAYAMGLVSEDVYYDLDCIREIRNDCAHDVLYKKGKRQTQDRVTFDQEDIKALALSLKYPTACGLDKWQKEIKGSPMPILAENPRARYEFTCQCLHMLIATGQSEKFQVPLQYGDVYDVLKKYTYPRFL